MWALLLSVALPIVYILPSGFIYAMTGQEVRFSSCFLRLLIDCPRYPDHAQHPGADHPGVVITREPAGEHGRCRSSSHALRLNAFASQIFKSYSVQTLTEATSFVQDLKLGHYVKVPPRASFVVQLVGTLVAAFIQVGVKTWIFSNVEDICKPGQKSQLTCPHNQVFFTASAIWYVLCNQSAPRDYS